MKGGVVLVSHTHKSQIQAVPLAEHQSRLVLPISDIYLSCLKSRQVLRHQLSGKIISKPTMGLSCLSWYPSGIESCIKRTLMALLSQHTIKPFIMYTVKYNEHYRGRARINDTRSIQEYIRKMSQGWTAKRKSLTTSGSTDQSDNGKTSVDHKTWGASCAKMVLK